MLCDFYSVSQEEGAPSSCILHSSTQFSAWLVIIPIIQSVRDSKIASSLHFIGGYTLHSWSLRLRPDSLALESMKSKRKEQRARRTSLPSTGLCHKDHCRKGKMMRGSPHSRHAPCLPPWLSVSRPFPLVRVVWREQRLHTHNLPFEIQYSCSLYSFQLVNGPFG